MAEQTILDVVMPQMGVSVSEGTVTRWLHSVGDTVAADEALLEVSTDKVDTEVPSPAAGVVTEILIPEGQTVAVGTVLARIGSDGATPPEGSAAEPPSPDREAAGSPAEPPSPPSTPEEPASTPSEVASPLGEPQASPGDSENGAPAAHSFVSPIVARIAAARGIDPSTISGSGHGGRVTKKDVLAFVGETGDEEPDRAPVAAPTAASPGPAAETPPNPLAQPPAAGAPPPTQTPADAPEQAEPPAPSVEAAEAEEQLSAELEPGESLEPLSVMRRGIAAHMRRSLDTAAHVTSAVEVDMSKVASIRERIKDDFASSYGVNPTYLAFIARATVETLPDWPWVNAELRGESILTRKHVNLGFAVALEGGKGLIVPVLRHAEGLNLLGMARGIADLGERARTKRLLPDDVQGGTFTITNPGVYGTLLGTPIISQPQSAILGTYAITKRPWVITDDAGQDAIAIRPIMNLTLTYDHRLVDGAYAAQFLRDLAARLETWGEADY